MKKILALLSLTLLISLPTQAEAVFNVGQGGTGRTTFPVGGFLVGNGTNPIDITFSPVVSALVATSTNATSTFAGNVLVGGDLRVNGNIEVGETGEIKAARLKAYEDLHLYNNAAVVFHRDESDDQSGYIITTEIGQYRFGRVFGDGTLDFSPLTQTRVFSFPDLSGTLGILEANQVFTGLNKFKTFEGNSTIHIGSPTNDSGCIALGDTDGDGFTYVTANDGVLYATTTNPGNCRE